MKRLRLALLALVGLVVIAYLGIVGYMYVNQRALQYNPFGEVTTLAEAGIPGAQNVAIPVAGSVVNGWYKAPSPGKPLIIYYKGNSESFSAEHERYQTFAAEGYGFLAFDYRGFPASPGSISEAGILDDSIAAFDWAQKQGFPLVIWGRSLGTGPSTYVASQRDALALLLETPFLSAVGVAAERYPFLPVSLVMLDQFHSDQWIANVTEPVFIGHGTADRTIDVSNGERLYDLVPNKDELWIVPGADHSDLWDAGIWAKAKAFFTRAGAVR
ncbi:alpha/beta hydrolase [Devosia sp. BK]|uniref:alpha/beta hydrolase n=1 Tax=Devosia sp. BK TaxID=2871706 RepID=UPI00293ACAD8|nr:alpha/beta hydrolase [Devosia sp. BK]MDV3252804.1 alpha/beta hydrolase [Devosia sp. BK]